MTPEYNTSKTCCNCNEKTLLPSVHLNPRAKKMVYNGYTEEEKMNELGKDFNNPNSDKIQWNSKYAEKFKEKYPKSKLNVKTRLLTCLKCQQWVCRDVNASFKICTNLIDLVYDGKLQVSTLKKDKEEGTLKKNVALVIKSTK
jgi:hypothetical protein